MRYALFVCALALASPSQANAQYWQAQQRAQQVYNLQGALQLAQAQYSLGQSQLNQLQSQFQLIQAQQQLPMPPWYRRQLQATQGQLSCAIQLLQSQLNIAAAQLQVGQSNLQVLRQQFYLLYGCYP